MVGPFLENHVFYAEHWHHCIFWNKIRQIGDLFVENKFLEDREQIMCLHHSEIGQALYELVTSWAVGTEARAPYVLPDLVNFRQVVYTLGADGAPGGEGKDRDFDNHMILNGEI